MRKGVPVFNREKPKKKTETVEPSTERKATDSENRHGIICHSNVVSVREYASEVAPVKDYLPQGEEVEILNETPSGFYLIRFGRLKRLGFVSLDFCREVN